MSEWKFICDLEDIPCLGAKTVKVRELGEAGNIAIFRCDEDQLFAVHDQCPHKKGPLSQGIIHGARVSCPLHGWQIDLKNGQAIAPDEGSCSVYEVKVENAKVYLKLNTH